MAMLCVCLSVVLLGLLVDTGFSHPQCLDFRPPFETNANEQLFCSEYQTFGCCNVHQDVDIKAKYEDIVSRMKNSVVIEQKDQKSCSDFLKQILCQECSPYAAHIYNSEADQVQQPFPGLCTGYCEEFYDKCQSLIPYISDDQTLVVTSRSEFCSAIRLPDVDYCFPDWIQLDRLNKSISREARTEEGCLCLELFAESESFKNALALRSPPDGTGRIFIAEQGGIVYVFSKNQTKLGTFMNMSDVVLTSPRRGDERGLLNIVFHPQFSTNNKLYIFFTLYKKEKSTDCDSA